MNANGYSSYQLSTIVSNFKKALKKNELEIPVTASFSNLPTQVGDTLSDDLVNAVTTNWDTTWNSNKPFVFIDPYPDAAGIRNAEGIYKWQAEVTAYYQTLHPSLQIFIGETGAEGSSSDLQTQAVIDSIFVQLNAQYKASNKTVPTFLFEAVNEPLKPSLPNQQFMGVYSDSNYPEKVALKLKEGVTLPSWILNE